MKAIKILVLVVAVIYLGACRKKDKDECPVCPSVESISPSSAKCYENITVFGKNFATTPSANIVKINGVQVSADSILSGTTDKIVVKVPRGCGTGPVTVDIDDELTNVGNPPIFTYDYRYVITDYGVAVGVATNPPSCIGGTKITTTNYINPTGIVADALGNIYFSDALHHCIYKLNGNDNRDSCVFAGYPSKEGHDDKLGTMATFRFPGQMYIDNSNTIYVAENSTSIRTISPSGNVATYTTDTNLNYSTGIAFQRGNTDIAYVSVLGDEMISKIERKNGKLITTIFAGGKGKKGYVDGIGTIARFNDPQDLVVDNSGNVFVSDANNVIRKITPGGVVSTFAGSGSPQFADGQGILASFNQPRGMFIDQDNTIYVADSKNNSIRKITPNGYVSTIYTFTASMNTPTPNGIARDNKGNYYITYQSLSGSGGNGVKKLTIF